MVWIQRVSAHETREHPAGRNAATGNGRALVVIPVLEFRRHVLEIGFRAKTNPGNSVLGTKLHWLADLAVYRHPARNWRLFNGFPFSGAATIDLKFDCAVAVHLDEQHLVVIAIAKIGVGDCARLDVLALPYRASTDCRTERVEVLWFKEPKRTVGLSGRTDAALCLALVEELVLCSIVATKHHFVAPSAEVSDDLEIVGARTDASRVLGAHRRREVPERAVHRHKDVIALADFADARPLGVPAVRTIVAV